MRRAAWLVGVALLAASSARAADVVIEPVLESTTWQQLAKDVEAAAKRLEMINNQIRQIEQLENTIAAVSHGNLAALGDLVSELGSDGVVSPLGADTTALLKALGGLAGQAGVTAGLTTSILNTDKFYSPAGLDLRASIINQAAASLAAQKALAQTSLNNSQKQLQDLQTLRNRLSSTKDVKAAADATARLAGEQATLQAQTNQLMALRYLQVAQDGTNAAQEQQRWRCASEVLQSQAASAASSSGLMLVDDTGALAKCASSSSSGTGTSSGSTVVASNYADGGSVDTTGSVVSGSSSAASVDDGSVLGVMTSQSWGQQAASNAAALGVNPTALAATCVLESNCSAGVGGTGTISGAFQMSNGTYAETVSAVQSSNPDLASQITGKNDPASQSIAASQYLLQGAQTLQSAGVSNPTVLDVRSYYQFGPANAASVATAQDNQLMSTVVRGLSSGTLAANGINANTTVGQWRSTVTNKIGSAAGQSVLLGGGST